MTARRHPIISLILALAIGPVMLLGLATMRATLAEDLPVYQSREELGAALFADVNLSRNRTQACATCHSPEFAFTDPRETELGRDVSLGDDGMSLGTRNGPSAAYAAMAPAFGRNAKGRYHGGLFLDGRAADLAAQAAGPPLNPLEMGMASEAEVTTRLRENPAYVQAFTRLFGPEVLDSDRDAFRAMTESIAAFERTEDFRPFDSRYDRFLRGEVQLTDEEELGRLLFFSNQFTNCHLCHQLRMLGGAELEPFSNFEFHNIGVPANPAFAGSGRKVTVDRGLAENPMVDPADRDKVAGQFKVPSLRNVAVTGPYMHNGVFKDLRTVILFYDKYNNSAPRRQVNPETGRPWDAPEVPENLSLKELETGPALDDQRINALVAFLRTLTDRRYEHLLAE
ncbi:cytochrome-c peroxidase [Dongia mobilis]|nr:cytochrome c peroxidase [Dongia mobilis]